MKWIWIIAFYFHAYACDTDCGRIKRTFGLLADQNDRDALHLHLWNDMNQEENYFPNILGAVATTPAPQEVDTESALQQLTELPQEMYRKSDRELYGKFYKLTTRNTQNTLPSNTNYFPTMMNYVTTPYKKNYRVQSVSQLPPIVRQSLYGMFKNPNQPTYYTNVMPRKKMPRLPTPIESDLIRIATGKIIANEPKPQKYHTFQLHEAMPGQKLLPPTRIPMFKPVPPPIKIVPIIDDDYPMMHLRPHRNRHLFRPHQPHPLHPSTFHPTTHQLNNTHPYPFHTEFNRNNIYLFKAQDAMTTRPAQQIKAPPVSVTTTTMSPMTTTDVATTATTTATSPSSTAPTTTLHVTYNQPTYPNVVYAVPATTESTNATQPTVARPQNNTDNSNRNTQHEFRIMSINSNKLRNGNKKGNATTRPTYGGGSGGGRRRPLRQKQKRRPLHGTNIIAQIHKPMPLTTTTTMTRTTTVTEPTATTATASLQSNLKWNHRNEPFRIVVNGDEGTTNDPEPKTTSAPTQQPGVVYGRPIEALIVDPPKFPNRTIEVNTPYSKQISNRNDQLEQQSTKATNAEDLMNLNRDIKRVLEVTSTPHTQTATVHRSDDDDDDDIHNDPLLMENLNKNEMMPIAADNIFDRGNLFSETRTKKRAFADTDTDADNRRSDNVDSGTVDVNSNAIDATAANTDAKALDEDKYYKWYNRYAADNKRKYGRAIISEHFKKVEIEPNVAWVILPR